MMRTGIPKYSQAWSLLAALGFLGFLLQRRLGSADHPWLGVLGGLFLAAAMTVMVVGMIAERKQAKGNRTPESSR
jgi:hypothetical protein